MRFKDKFKALLADKGESITSFAELQGLSRQTVANILCRDNLRYNTLESWLNTLDADIAFIDRKTGKIYL